MDIRLVVRYEDREHGGPIVSPTTAPEKEDRPARPARGRLRRFCDGALYVPRGIGLFLRRPRLWLYGLLPVTLSAGLVLIAAFALAFLVDDVTEWATPFADGWPGWLRGSARFLAGLTVVAGFVLAVVLTFAEVTNVLGQPFFEIIADEVEKERGNAPPGVDTPWWRTLPIATLESAVTVSAYLALVVPLFILGFLPLVGQTVVPVVTALVSGYFLALEILQIPLERRGMRLRRRVSFHWRPENRLETVGFGVAAFVLFLVPLMNIVAMPGAIVGATLLVRHLTGAERGSPP